MSMHAIEDLVEDTVRLIAASSHCSSFQKRNIFYNLYAVQELFDTSYTHFRVMDELLKYHFVYKIPAAPYPQLGIATGKLPVAGDAQWICGDDDSAPPVAYGENEQGTVYLYIDAGDSLWSRLCELNILSGEDCTPPEKFTVPRLTKEVLAEAERQQNTLLLNQWYNMFVNGILEYDFSTAEGISATFPEWLADESLATIRATVQRNDAGQQKKRRGEDDYMGWPGLTSSLEFAKNIEETYRIRYLLDLGKSPEQLERSYKKDHESIQATPQKIALISQAMQPYFDTRGWTAAATEQENRWLWYKDLKDERFNGPGHRLFVLLELDLDERTLFCKQGLQHSLLLRWQKKQPGLLPRDWHFYTDIIPWLPATWTDRNKHLGKWGSWIFDVKQSEKVISGHVEDLVTGMQMLDNAYFDFVLAEFPEKYFHHDPGRLLYLLEEGEDGTGIIPKYVLFDSKFTTLIAFAAYYAEQGNAAMAAEIAEKITTIAGSERVSAKQQEIVLDPFLDHWTKGKEIYFPPVWHYYLVRSLSS